MKKVTRKEKARIYGSKENYIATAKPNGYARKRQEMERERQGDLRP